VVIIAVLVQDTANHVNTLPITDELVRVTVNDQVPLHVASPVNAIVWSPVFVQAKSNIVFT
jgi:hypothetical protein